ncbi:MAG: rhodanese-like domain-containing protein [Pseudobdellovibrionaceae bacterium]
MTKFKTKKQNPHFENVMDVHPEEVSETAATLQIIDVRQPDEYTGELGHINDSELLVLDTLPEKLNRLSKSKTVVFVCRSGGRSARAADFAFHQGFTDVYNMEGGMLFWNQLGLPLATK